MHRIYAYIYMYIKKIRVHEKKTFHPYPLGNDDFFRGLPLARRLQYYQLSVTKCFKNVYTTDEDTTRVVSILLSKDSGSSMLIFNTYSL